MAKNHDVNLLVIKEFQVTPPATTATHASTTAFTACQPLFQAQYRCILVHLTLKIFLHI